MQAVPASARLPLSFWCVRYGSKISAVHELALVSCIKANVIGLMHLLDKGQTLIALQEELWLGPSLLDYLQLATVANVYSWMHARHSFICSPF